MVGMEAIVRFRYLEPFRLPDQGPWRSLNSPLGEVLRFEADIELFITGFAEAASGEEKLVFRPMKWVADIAFSDNRVRKM